MPRVLLVAALAVASLSVIGCADPSGSEEEGEEELATAGQEVRIDNGLTANGLMTNGLTANGLTANGAVMSLLEDDDARKILAYVTTCALPMGERFDLTIDGHPYTFEGALGLAPGWGGETGSCDADCQSWVSGCILSRVNYTGDAVPISLRGPSASLVSAPEELAEFPSMEAVYFGDLFSDPPKRFACTAHGSTLIERVCGPSTTGCVVDVVGDCDDYFTLGGAPTARCGIPDTGEGYYPDCRDNQGTTHLGSVTVYRQCGNGVCDTTETTASCPQDC